MIQAPWITAWTEREYIYCPLQRGLPGRVVTAWIPRGAESAVTCGFWEERAEPEFSSEQSSLWFAVPRDAACKGHYKTRLTWDGRAGRPQVKRRRSSPPPPYLCIRGAMISRGIPAQLCRGRSAGGNIALRMQVTASSTASWTNVIYSDCGVCERWAWIAGRALFDLGECARRGLRWPERGRSQLYSVISYEP